MIETGIVHTKKPLSDLGRQDKAEAVRKRMDDLYLEMKWKQCPQCKEEYTNLEDEKLCPECERRDQGIKEKDGWLKKHVGLKAISEFSFSGFCLDDGNDKAYKICKEFNPDSENIYLWGSSGVGKTHLAYAVIQTQFYQGRSIHAANPAAISRRFRRLSGFEEEDEIEKFISYPVLLIDDLGAEKTTEFLLSIFYEIVNRRIMNKKNGLIVTSNLDLEALMRKFGDNRLSSRLAGMCHVVEIVGADRR